MIPVTDHQAQYPIPSSTKIYNLNPRINDSIITIFFYLLPSPEERSSLSKILEKHQFDHLTVKKGFFLWNIAVRSVIAPLMEQHLCGLHRPVNQYIPFSRFQLIPTNSPDETERWTEGNPDYLHPQDAFVNPFFMTVQRTGFARCVFLIALKTPNNRSEKRFQAALKSWASSHEENRLMSQEWIALRHIKKKGLTKEERTIQETVNTISQIHLQKLASRYTNAQTQSARESIKEEMLSLAELHKYPQDMKLMLEQLVIQIFADIQSIKREKQVQLQIGTIKNIIEDHLLSLSLDDLSHVAKRYFQKRSPSKRYTLMQSIILLSSETYINKHCSTQFARISQIHGVDMKKETMCALQRMLQDLQTTGYNILFQQHAVFNIIKEAIALKQYSSLADLLRLYNRSNADLRTRLSFILSLQQTIISLTSQQH